MFTPWRVCGQGLCACRCVRLYRGLDDACASWRTALGESPWLRADHLFFAGQSWSGSRMRRNRKHTSPSLYAQKYTPSPITW